MNDRPEFLERLKADLGAGLPGFRSRRRRRRIVGSAVGGLALLAGVGAVVASGGDEPRDSVSAVGDVPEAPAYQQSQAELSISVSTGTVRDLTDTVGDLVDGALPIGTALGGPLNLVANGGAPGGAVQACPAGATTQEGSVLFEGELQELNESDDVVRFVSEHIRNTYPPGTPIRTSVVYEAATSVRGRARAVLAPWVGEDALLVGAWFSVSKIDGTLAIGSDWGCTPFLWGYGDDTGSIAPTGEVVTCRGGRLVSDFRIIGPSQIIEDEDLGAVEAFVQAHIDSTFPAGAPISESSIFIPTPRPLGPVPLLVFAPWPDEDELIGMWFAVKQTGAGFEITESQGCRSFVTAAKATTLSTSELDALIGGLRTGPIDYRVGQTPAELRSFVDVAVRGTVAAVHEGRTLRDLLNPSGLNDEPFATLEIEGEESAATGSVRDGSTFYIEIQMGDLRDDQLQVLVGTEVIAFGTDTSDVDLGEQWAIDNPLGGRPDAGQPIFTVYPQGLLLVTEESVVGVYDELPVGWSPAQNFTTGTEAADWVVTEAEK